jgi:hypothetical protein
VELLQAREMGQSGVSDVVAPEVELLQLVNPCGRSGPRPTSAGSEIQPFELRQAAVSKPASVTLSL